MKFLCDSCGTKYSIADDRVKGRVLKIRCKTCNHVVTVREDMPVPQVAIAIKRPTVPINLLEHTKGIPLGLEENEHTVVSAGLGPSAASSPSDEWYVSFDGDQEGPMPLARALDRVRTERPRGKEAHAWKPGFFVWLPVDEVPEFAPALRPVAPARPVASARPAVPAKPAPPARPAEPRRATGPQPAIAKAAVAIKREAMAPQPVARAMGGKESSARPQVVAPLVDSKPTPLPPPPSAAAYAPLSMEGLAPTVAKGAADVSPFRAALAQGAASIGEPAPPPVDTGPVPLPPPPGIDDPLKIDEPDLHPSPNAARAPVGTGRRPAIDTFGGVAITPAGTGAPASPVVVVAGPALQGHAWHKWAALGGLLLSLGLGAAVVYLILHRPGEVAPPAVARPSRIPGDEADKPFTVVDPTVPRPQAPIAPSEIHRTQAAPTRRASGRPVAAKNDPVALSRAQKDLANLYADSNDRTPHAIPSLDRGSQSAGASQAAILAVVTQNRRALNLCYDRVLKHDASLKRARLVTHVKVGISGTVIDASVPDPQYASSEIGQCIVQTIKHWHFPAADSQYETEFPIILQAQ